MKIDKILSRVCSKTLNFFGLHVVLP